MRAATNSNQQPDAPNVGIMPPRMFSICLLFGIALELFWPSALPFMPAIGRMILGGTLAFGGFVFMMWGHNRFTNLGVEVSANSPSS